METSEPTLRLEALEPEHLRSIAAICIGSCGRPLSPQRGAEVARLRLTCRALLEAAEAAIAHGLVEVWLRPKAWPPPSMRVLTRCARHLDLYECREQVTNEAVRQLAEAAPDLVGLILMDCRHVTDIAPLASLKSLTFLLLWSTGVKSVKALRSCTSLTELDLWFTSVTDASTLASIEGLRIHR
jgi:hypothetical protein